MIKPVYAVLQTERQRQLMRIAQRAKQGCELNDKERELLQDAKIWYFGKIALCVALFLVWIRLLQP